MRIFLSALLLLFFTVACGSAVNTPTATSTLTPTIHPVETKTLTPPPTESSTETPDVSATPSSTADPAGRVLYSPNGELVAKWYDEFTYSSGKQTIEVQDKSGRLIWKIPYQGEMPTGDPHPSLILYRWSKDSSVLYFFYSQYPDGGNFAFWWDGFDLQKLIVATGKIQSVVPGKGFLAFSFSPDETHIAYTRAQDMPKCVIFIRDLVTGTDKKVSVKLALKNYVRVGNLMWSPSGKNLEFQIEDDDYGVQTFYLDTTAIQPIVVNEYRLPAMWLEGWNGDDKLRFISLKSEISVIDINTQETTIIGTATPKP